MKVMQLVFYGGGAPMKVCHRPFPKENCPIDMRMQNIVEPLSGSKSALDVLRVRYPKSNLGAHGRCDETW